MPLLTAHFFFYYSFAFALRLCFHHHPPSCRSVLDEVDSARCLIENIAEVVFERDILRQLIKIWSVACACTMEAEDFVKQPQQQ